MGFVAIASMGYVLISPNDLMVYEMGCSEFVRGS